MYTKAALSDHGAAFASDATTGTVRQRPLDSYSSVGDLSSFSTCR